MRYAFTLSLTRLSLLFKGNIGVLALIKMPLILILIFQACDDRQEIPANFVAGFTQSTLTVNEASNTYQIDIRMDPASTYDGTIKVWVKSYGANYNDDFTIDPAISNDNISSWFQLPIKTGDTKVNFKFHLVDDTLTEAKDSVEFTIDSLNGLTVLQTNPSKFPDRLMLIIIDND